MKSTISGFNQEYALTLKKKVTDKNGKTKSIQIDCTDLAILRWLVDFYPSMKKISVDGREYAWLTHKKLMEDMPILDISKRGCIDRMQKLVEFGILDYKLLKDEGMFSLYAFGENYINLVRSTNTVYAGQPTQGMLVNQHRVCGSTNIGYVGQPAHKDNSIIDISIKDNKRDIYRESIEAQDAQEAPPPPDPKPGKKKPEKPEKHQHGEFKNVLLTDDELKKLQQKFPSDWQRRIDDLSYAISSKGYKYSSHYATILNWARKDSAKQAGRPAQAANVGPNGIVIDPSKTDMDGAFR